MRLNLHDNNEAIAIRVAVKVARLLSNGRGENRDPVGRHGRDDAVGSDAARGCDCVNPICPASDGGCGL